MHRSSKNAGKRVSGRRLARTAATASEAADEPRAEAPKPPLYCPFSGGCSPHADAVQAHSLTWVTSHQLVHSQKQRSKLRRSRVGLLEARAFHDASREVLQLASDWTTLFCLLDDLVEFEGVGPLGLSGYLVEVLDVMAEEPDDSRRPGLKGAFADLRNRMRALGGEAWTRRWRQQLSDLFVGYVWEETNRWGALQPDFETYCAMRTITIGLRLQFMFGELCPGSALVRTPELSSAIRPLEDLTCRAVGWANDLFTYEKELKFGEVHNLVMVLARQKDLDIPEAVRQASQMHDDTIRALITLSDALPPSMREDSRGYVHMLQGWTRAHLDWAELTGRYCRRLSMSEIPVQGLGG